MDLVPYLKYFLSLDTRAYFSENQEARAPRAERAAIKLGNQTARAAITIFVNRDIKTILQWVFCVARYPESLKTVGIYGHFSSGYLLATNGR